MKPNSNLPIASANNVSEKPTSNLRDVAEYVANTSAAAISLGVSKPNASNGTPMSEIHGAANTAAILKNIGIEAKEGGGMNDGINTILLNAKANSVIQTLDYVETTPQKAIKGKTSKT